MPHMIDETALASARTEAIARYVSANPKSEAIYRDACESLPGGNTRTVLFFKPFPLCIDSGHGCHVTDADGHDYVNVVGEFTAALFGHSNPVIRAAIDKALDGGVHLSGHNSMTSKLAAVICQRFPSIDLVRFTNSGTEANLLALAAATLFTKRRKILVFEKGYHGSVLSFPTPGGSPINTPHEFVVASYNDIPSTLEVMDGAGDDLAAILVEPMQGAGGCTPGTPEFLSMLREEATARGALLIFDEVMTSRLSPGGLQARLEILPDMTTIGKYIGGGMSFGAFGGRTDIMSMFDPRPDGYVDHPGTFNNNVLTMAAGYAGMTEVLTPEALNALNKRGDDLREGLNALFRSTGAPFKCTGLGSIMAIHALAEGEAAEALKELMFFDLLARGIYCARRGLIVLGLPVDEAITGQILDAFADFISTQKDLFIAPAAAA